MNLFSFSQSKKGDKILGGNININKVTNEGKLNSGVFSIEESQSVFVNPNLGFYITDNVVFGIGLGIQSYENKEEERQYFSNQSGFNSITTRSEGSFHFANIFMNFQGSLIEKLKFNLNTNLRIIRGNTEYYQTNLPDAEGKFKGTSFSVSPGLFYWLTKRVILTARYGQFGLLLSEEVIDYKTTADNEATFEQNDIGFDYGVESFVIGFQYKISKREK